MPWSRRLSASGWLILGCTALGGVLRFLLIGNQSIWVDEAFSIKMARLFTPLELRHVIDDLHGPLHSMLLHGWGKMFGTSEVALRSLEALASTATIPVLAWALGPLRRPRTTVVAIFLLAINPFHIWYAQEIRNYSLFILLTTLSSGVFVRLGKNTRGTWGYGVVNFLAFHANLAHLFTLLTHCIVQAVNGWRDWAAWRRLLRTWVLTGVLMIPWIIGFYQHQVLDSSALTTAPVPAEERKRGETTAPIAGIPYSFFVYSVGYSYGPSLRELRSLSHDLSAAPLEPHLPALLFAGLVFAPLALVGVWRLLRAGKEARIWLLLLIVPMFATLAVATRNLKVFNPRYASAAVPAYVLALAEGVTASRRRGVGVALGALIAIPTGVSLAQHYRDPRYAKEDARSATRFLKAETGPGDYIFVIGTDEPLERYYWRGLRKNPDGITKGDVGYWHDRAPGDRFALFDAERAGHDRAFVLFLREHFADPEGDWRVYLEQHHPPVAKTVFPGVEIWELPPAPTTLKEHGEEGT